MVTLSKTTRERKNMEISGHTAALRREFNFDSNQFDSAEKLSMVEALSSKFKDRKSTRLNSSHTVISYAVFCLKKKIKIKIKKKK